MKITIYVITYKNDKILNEWLLASLANSNYPKDKICLHIQNNFSDKVVIDKEFETYVNYIHHNTIRLSRSFGHLSRDWNHGIMNGFVDLNKPRSDMVMLLQNDTKLTSDWYEKTCDVMQDNYFVSFGAGDQCMIIRPECVKKVGMIEERFCSLSWQEYDYFLRCILRIPMKTSINDEYHQRLHRPLNYLCPIKKTETGMERKENYFLAGTHYESENFLKKKWPCRDMWGESSWLLAKKISQSGAPLVPMYIMYPYFEKDIDQSVYKQWSLFRLA
jgi:hypothetical protein